MERMKNLAEDVHGWLSKGMPAGGKVEVASYGHEIVMARLEGEAIKWALDIPDDGYHISLLMIGGELHLTLNGDRMGFVSPVYIDFIDSNRWENVHMDGCLKAYLLVVERNFFHEVTVKLRSRISEKMMEYVRSPFVLLEQEEAERLGELSSVLFGVMLGGNDVFHRELLQSLLSSCQCELWNTIFRRHESVYGVEESYHWGDTVSHFLYLVHTFCCERHEVNWYCEQLGVSVNALNAALKRLYGKTARSIIDELLLTEAKVALRNPGYSVQDVSDQLCFSDQSAFGKFFKRCCGVSPALFRRELEKEKTPQ